MFKCFSSFWQFLNYWYFRYLMVTELYMVEKWERAVCNITIVIFLSILSLMNCALLRYTAKLFNLVPPEFPNSIFNSTAVS